MRHHILSDCTSSTKPHKARRLCPLLTIFRCIPLLIVPHLNLIYATAEYAAHMPSKPRFLCMDKDDLAWQKLDEDTERWEASIRTNEVYRAVGKLILEYKDGLPELMHSAVKGGYNIVYRLEYKDGSSAIMRIPINGIVC